MAKKIYTEEEARLRKNARQREYAKRTHYAVNKKCKESVKRYYLETNINTEPDIVSRIEAKRGTEGVATYIKRLIREDMEKERFGRG